MITNPSKKRDYIMAKADKSAAKEITLGETKQFVLSSFQTNVPQPDIDYLGQSILNLVMD